MVVSSLNLVVYGPSDVERLVASREGETKIGQELRLLSSTQLTEFEANLHLAALDGAHYAVLGVPEDIGPRANFERGGADGAWPAFLESFLNLQSNQFFDTSRLLLIGHIQVADLMKETAKLADDGHIPVHKLREFCGQLDKRIAPVIEQIVSAGLEPVVIGGGNNNSYPILKGVVSSLRQKGFMEAEEGLAVVNCDAHADFRILEGRHSGNAFTYAHADDLLQSYFVLGLQEAYNSSEMFERLESADFLYVTYDQFAIRHELTFDEAVQRLASFIYQSGSRLGLELDLDAVAHVPSSGGTGVGISHEEASHYIYALASSLDTSYFHVSEGAPKLAPDGDAIVGRAIASYVLTYMKGRETFKHVLEEQNAENAGEFVSEESE
jgi:formiminoglutamase